MLKIFEDNTVRIQKRKLCQGKRNAMFFLIAFVFIGVPIKIRLFFHAYILGWKRKNVNINIWLFMWLF